MIAGLKQKSLEALRFSERFLKIDMVYVAKGSFWITFGQVASNVLSLLLVIAFANLLPKETYGLYRYILSLAAILNVFSLTGMNGAVARAVAAGQEGALQTSVRYQLRWNILMLSAFWALSGYYFMQDDSLFAMSFLILGIFVPATLAFNTYGAYLEGKKEFKLASISSIVSTFVYGLGMLATLLLTKEIIWLIITYAATTFATTLFFYLFTLYTFKPPKTPTEETLKYGRELTFIGFIGPVASQIDKIILAHFYGVAQLALYSLAIAIPDRATYLIKNWVGLGFPKFATKTPREINETFYLRTFQGIAVGLVCFISYILVAPYLFKYLLPQYIDAVTYSQILAVSFVFAIPNRYVSLLLVSQKLSRVIFTNSLIQNILKIILYLVLGIQGGIMGLVSAFVIMSFIGMLINIAMWRKNS
ncbi:MAG: oligosaccharide flippase family protein [Patescibacteria group bacterium]